MPWMETCIMSERIKLVADFLEGRASMSALCRHYGISRRVGYKWVKRFKDEGPEGLLDRLRAPKHRPQTTDAGIVALLVAAKKDHPRWGPKKLVVWLQERHPHKGYL